MTERHEDPVCGMPVDRSNAIAASLYNGQEYLFCSESCKAEFDRNPERYADAG